MIQQTPGKKDKEAPVPQISFSLDISSLKIKLCKSQYECIFRLAEYVRQYQLKIDNFNRHRKYKHIRPLYPLHSNPGRLALKQKDIRAADIKVHIAIDKGNTDDQSLDGRR